MTAHRNFSWLNVICVLITVTVQCQCQIIQRCPDYQVHFEKIIGFRPPLQPYGLPPKLLFKAFPQIPSVINLQCMERCRNDHNCESYLLNFNQSECYGFTSNERRLDSFNLRRLDDHELVEDIGVVYFVKTCLNIPLTCKTTHWPLLRIPGSSLVGKGYLTVNKLLTRRECIERCVFETSFKCRSLSFQATTRNNMARTGFANLLNKDTLGRCILSRDDKNTEPDAFRVAQFNDEYIENQCHVVMNGPDQQFLDDLCAYEHYPDSAFMYAEHQYVGLTDRECQEKCFKEKFFFCKGITYQKMDRVDNSRCYIHSEDVLSMGPRAVVAMRSSYYMKRVQCLNLNVRCTQNEMIIRYQPRQYFQGRIYTDHHADECGTSGSHFGPTFLTLPLGSSTKEQRCGVHRAFDFETPNRTLIFTYIIIQNNPLVMMQSDRYIKVGCISRYSRTGGSGVPDTVSLEASVDFSGNKDYEGFGSLVIDDGGDIPHLSMYILDPVEDVPIKEAKIGQVLKFVISMDSQINDFDLRAINLTATTDLDNSLELIGSTGCPKNAAIFPAFQHETTPTAKRLVTKFKAFKFASSTQIRFNVMIQFCHKTCKPFNCGYGIVSYGKKRRRRAAKPLDVIESSTFGKISFPGEVNVVESRDDSSNSMNNDAESINDEVEVFLPTTLTTKVQPTTISSSKSEPAATESTEKSIPGPIKFPGPVSFERIVQPSVGIRLDNFGNPQGIQQYLTDGSRVADNEVTESRSEKIVTIPLDITINIFDSGLYENGTDRLIVGDNDKINVAGLATTATLCLDQSLLIAILIFWMIFQVLILLACCIMVRKYRKFSSLDEDHSSIDHPGYYPDSLDSRPHVRWADQNHRSHIGDGYFT